MKKITTKRAVGFAAAMMMTLCLILSAIPVSAAGSLSARATVASGSLESTASSDIIVYFTHSDYSGATPSEAKVTANGSGGLSCSYSGTASVSGSDGALSFQITIPKSNVSYDGMSSAGLTLNVTYTGGAGGSYSTTTTVPVTKDPQDNTPVTPPAIAGNIFTIQEDAPIPSIDAGKQAELSYPIESSKRISGDVQITAQLPEQLYFTTASATQTMSFIRSGAQKYTFTVSADSELKSGTYPVTLTVNYKYSGEAKSETITTYVKVNGKAAAEEAVSDLVVTGYTVNPSNVKAGANFKIAVTVKNNGNATCKNALVTMGGSSMSTEAFTMNGTLDSQTISSLAAGASTTLTFSLCSNSKMASGNYILEAAIGSGETSTTSKIFVPVTGNPEAASEEAKNESTPQLIIDSYTYGEEGVTSVVGGEVFTLSAVIRNTGKIAVSNVKITVSATADAETGGAFSPANSSNTFYIESIPAGGSITQSIDLLPKADAKPKSYGVDFAFSYEALVNDELVTKDLTQTIAIPLTQPDRFEVGEPTMYGPVDFGQTLNGYVSYVNKGKSTIFNLSMKVEGEGFTTAEAETYIGNVESGSSDGYDIAINPTQAGPISGTITFTYEDSNGDTKEIVKNFQSEVMEYVEPEIPDGGMMDPNMPVDAEGGMPIWGWIAIAGGAVVVIVIAAVLDYKIVKKKKQAALDAEDDYDDDDTGAQQ